MRLLQLLSIVVIGYIVWKLVKLIKLMRNSSGHDARQRVDFPQDQAYKNIEDADFEDLGRDPDKTS